MKHPQHTRHCSSMHELIEPFHLLGEGRVLIPSLQMSKQAQRGEVAYLSSHSKEVVVLEFEPAAA